MPARKEAATAAPGKKKRRAPRKKVAAGSKGLAPNEVIEGAPEAAQQLAEQIRADGGATLGIYRDPLGGHPVVIAALPIEKVEPTPYQRDVSEPHVKRLANAMERVDRFLDPLIAVRHDGVYWTPNGNHRLHASKLLGAKSVIALVLPEADVAYQILALNTEKAHNLKERSLEVIRMYRGLLGADPKRKETDYAAQFEEPSFITFGACYEKRPRYSAGAYNSIVKRVDTFQDEPFEDAIKLREARCDKLLAFDDAVIAVVDKLKQRGLQSPYLKNFVVGRVNYLRFAKETPGFDHAIDKMMGSVEKFNVERVNKEDIGRMGGAPAEAEE